MNKILPTIIFIAVLAAVAWFGFNGQADAAGFSPEASVSLTEADLIAIVQSQDRSGEPIGQVLAASPDARKKFTAGLREHLALAAAARDEGLHRDPNAIRNFVYKRKQLLAAMYEAHLGHSAAKPLPVSDEEINALFSDAAAGQRFVADLEMLRSIQAEVAEKTGSGMMPGRLQGESLEKAKKRWARSELVSRRAEGDAEFMASPAIGLRLRVLESGVLSNEYLRKHWAEKVRATDEEIRRFIAERPEYDVNLKRARAADLLGRIRAGESIERIAGQHSEHRPSKANGGLVENVRAGDMPPDFENAVLALKPGEIHPAVLETDLGFHVVQLVSSTAKRDASGREQTVYSFRQVVLQRGFEQPGISDPNVPPPFMTAEEIARAAIEEKKRGEWITELIARFRIEVPEDFSLPAA